MTDTPPRWVAALYDVWFQQLSPDNWFGKSDAVDALLKREFEADLRRLGEQSADTFLTDLPTAQAAVLLFDQVPRNLYRGTAQAFAYDPLAVAIAKEAIARGWDTELPDRERQFLAMPLMHSEELADQEASIAYFGEHLPDNASFAESHHQMIARFGRFPHRNAALGRTTTAEEQRAIDDGFSW